MRLMFGAQIVAEKSFGISLEDILGLHYPPSMAFRPWQFITYMFMHGNFWHLAFQYVCPLDVWLCFGKHLGTQAIPGLLPDHRDRSSTCAMPGYVHSDQPDYCHA